MLQNVQLSRILCNTATSHLLCLPTVPNTSIGNGGVLIGRYMELEELLFVSSCRGALGASDVWKGEVHIRNNGVTSAAFKFV
ncbi:hypothetical protein JTB14_034335 [Gonioctena quinquepunctata]|nr:hypothetical protein JTB14_034335 [Gonioctena quinquepunctata]